MITKPSQIENPVFDPNKSYTWEQNTQFTFNGSEFGFILNTLRKTLSTAEAQSILASAQALQIIEKQLADAVTSGVAKEISEEDIKKQLEKTS
jgi:hypothetical protein